MRLLARSVLAALAGVAAGLAFEPYHWVVLLPARRRRGDRSSRVRAPRLRSGFWVGFVFGTAFMLVLLPWLQVIGVYAWIPLAVARGAVLRARRARHPGRGRGCRGWPVWAATAWVLVEALRAVVPFGGLPLGPPRVRDRGHPAGAATFAYVGAPGHHLRRRPARHHARVGGAARSPGARARGGRRSLAAARAGLPGVAAAVATRPRAPPRAAWPRCRATCPARGSRRSPSGGRSWTTTWTRPSGSPPGSTPARRRGRTWWCGRRTPPTSTPTPTPAPRRRSATPPRRSVPRC